MLRPQTPERCEDASSATHGLWASTATVARTPYPVLEGDVAADVAIVGGGFMGLSTALHLAEAGASVCVLEATSIGYGASGRNGGQVNAGGRASLRQLEQRHGSAGASLYWMAQSAPDYLGKLIVRHRMDAGFERKGSLKLAHTAVTASALEDAAKELQGLGIAAEVLDRDAVRTRVGTDRYVAALVDPRGAAVHPLNLAREYARVAASFGAHIFERSRVVSVRRAGAGWRLATSTGAVDAREVVFATNAYTDDSLPALGRSILPVNSFQIATAPLGAGLAAQVLPEGQTAHDTRRLILYFRRLADGRVVLGGRASFDSSRTSTGAKADYDVLRRVLIGIFPILRDAPITHRWTGLVGITLDRMPHYSQPEPGLHTFVGFNGRGVAMTSRAGAWMARRLLGESDEFALPTVPLRPIPFHRFRRPFLAAAMRWYHLMDTLGY